MKKVSRRVVLGGAAGAAAAGTTPLVTSGLTEPAAAIFDNKLPALNLSPLIFHSPRVVPFVEELPPLPVQAGTNFEITASNGVHKFHPDYAASPTFRYGTPTYLGPTLEVQAHTDTTMTFKNRVGAHVFAKDIDTTLHGSTNADKTNPRLVVHLHGGVQDPENDGHPEATLLPGQDFTYRYPLNQEATHLWYHDHALAITRLNAYAGLVGNMLVRDEFDTGTASNPLGLPSGKYEMPLVLQEKIFDRNGVHRMRSTPVVPEGGWEGGFVGDVGVVNGKAWPKISVDRALYRFRVVNGGPLSVYNLYFSNQMSFWVIGSDGGLLNRPAQVTELEVSPGERYDILVDFSTRPVGEKIELKNNEPIPAQAALIGSVTMPVFCRFEVGSVRGPSRTVPTTLRGGANQPPLIPELGPATVVRNFTINQNPLELRLPPAFMTLNNLDFMSDDIEKPRQGVTEQWNLINVTLDPHPIHIHLVNFKILGRQSINTPLYMLTNPIPLHIGTKWNPSADRYVTSALKPANQYESGWKDTVLVPGNSITRIKVRFPTAAELGFDPDGTFTPLNTQAETVDSNGKLGGYMLHCHVFDHEDHDMMLRYRLLP